MKKIKSISFIAFSFLISSIQAQTKELKGQLIANDDIEGIHILNRTSTKYAISKQDGSFVILAKVSDTLFVSGLKYQNLEYVITRSIMDLGSFSIQLIEKINKLNEVVIGKILTGSLESDIQNSDIKADINFYDLGIQANTDLPLTQSEQRLYDADHGQFAYYYGIVLILNVHKILNRVNGDTEKYRKRIEIELKEKCLNRLKSEYSSFVFKKNEIPKINKEEFFQFCAEDSRFNSICKEDNELKAVNFLFDKIEIFKAKNLQIVDD